MKRSYFLLSFCLLAIVAQAQLMHEPFDYTAHATQGLSVQSNLQWLRVNSGDSILVTSGSLSYPGIPASTGNKVSFEGSGTDYYRSFASQTSGTVYASFLINVSTIGSLDATGGYFLGFNETGSTTLFGAVVWARLSATPGKYNLGIATRSSSSPVSWTSADLDPTATYFVVISYSMVSGSANDNAKIWINTTAIGAAEPTADATAVPGASDLASVGSIFLRQDSPAETPGLEIDEIRVGAAWNEVTPGGGAAPALSVTSSLAAFGTVCISTSAGPNSFTLSGANLSTANVAIAALAGYSYSTTSGGTYSSTLSITQPGGTFNQTVYVKFDPTAVQSYDGNIVVSGGGIAAPVNVAASGSGIGATAPVLTTGSSSSVTANTATLAGAITNTGCSSITAYGIEYSTTSGFANGSGTAVPSTNLAGGDFSSDISGLTASTTYYYHAYATNGTGTGYGTEQSFTTSSGSGPVAGVVISQVYGGGGGSTGTYKNDYIELHNNSASSQSLDGLSLQYGSATGNFGSSTSNVYAFPAGTSIAAGAYLLIQLGPAGGGGIDLPVSPDLVTANLTMSGSSGKVVLANQATALGCGATATPCALPASTIIDLVAYGTANNGEGNTTVNNGSALTTTQGGVRKNNGCTDTDNNNADFDVITAPVPRNSASPVFSCGSSTPALSLVSALPAFGNICVGTSAGPNEFTLSGSNLTTADIMVGALPGYTYSTSAGGTYSSSLAITQAGGSFNQTVYVKFDPALAQSYDGNIAVSGGGVAVPLNVAASGSGVAATVPVLTTGSASAITTASATLAGTISSTGCSAITAYGIEYSTTSGFANGSGTAVPSANLSAGTFSSDLAGLSAGTTYYYHAYATNTTGTGYGTEQSFTTSSSSGPVTGIVISQVYGGGGGTTGTYKPDYVELHNNGTAAQTLDGTSLQYGSATGNFGSSSTNIYAIPAGTSIPAGGYLLIQLGAVGSGGVDLPVAPDLVTTNLNMSGSSGKVVFANQVTALGCGATATPCTLPASTIIDLVAWGTANNAEGGVSVNNGAALTSTQGAVRKNNGCTDTDDNNADFDVITAPVPRNSASTPFSCSSTPTPTIVATTLAAFGNVCPGNTAGPNAFTITGANLTNADITVGPLTGYTFSSTAGGTYSNSLTLTQPGGSFNQDVYVIFSPVAAQSYDGNILIDGGGISSPVSVPVSGAGVNTSTLVTSGTASSVTISTAVVAGAIPATGCTAITAYGIEYSTTSGFANGTQVPSANLTGTDFTSSLSGLNPATTYYYKAYATDGSGTVYGSELSFTTATPPPALTATSLNGFGSVCAGTTVGPNSFTLTGSNLTAANVSVGPLMGYTFSTSAGGTYAASLSIAQPGGSLSQEIFVKFSPVITQSYNGNIPVAGGGAASFNVAATGIGVFTTPTVTTNAATGIGLSGATIGGHVGDVGCGVVNEHGIEFSAINNFATGTGTVVSVGSIISNADFTTTLSGLVQGQTYYYRAFARNTGGTSYGAQLSFTLESIPNGFTLYPVPAIKGSTVHLSMNDLTPGYYGLLFFNSSGQLAFQKNIHIQANFINEDFVIPAALGTGIYRVQLMNNFKVLASKSVLITGQ